jgi:hypothetical protein
LTRSPLDPESYDAAKAANNLAQTSCNLIRKKSPDGADIEEADVLARKSFLIMRKICR